MGNFVQRLFSSWRGSTLQVIAAIILPLTFLLVVISFGSYFIHQNAMRSMVGERDERSVIAAASVIDAEIHHRAQTIQGLALLAGDGSKENLARALASSSYLTENFDVGMAYFDKSGAILASSGDKRFLELIPQQKGVDSIFTATAQADHPNVVPLTVNEKPVVLVSSTSPDNKIVAVGVFSAANLLQSGLAKDFPKNGNAAIYIFDPAFTILYQSGPGTLEGDPAQHPGIADALAGKSGATYMQVANDEHVLAYSAISTVGWAIIIEESWEAVSNPTLQTSQITPMILIPALLLAVLALWFGAEQIVKPLRALEAKAAKLAWGDFKDIENPVQGIAEIRHLQTELTHMAHRLQAAQQSLHSYIGAITQGQEDERQRLARELHDDTIQSLIALKQRAQLTRMSLPKDIPLKNLTELETLTEQTIENLRRTIRALRPIYLEDLGLVAALEMLANETRQNSSTKVEFHVLGNERRLAADVELALYRMLQESLSNTVRHAQATQASIDVEFAAESVDIRVNDNGVGFEVPKSPTEFAPSGHFGLVGLYERAQLIGARLEITSSPGKGAHLSIHLPTKTQTTEQ